MEKFLAGKPIFAASRAVIACCPTSIPTFFLTVEVHSIPHSLTLLGERGIRRWVSLVAMIARGGPQRPQRSARPRN